MSSVSAGERVIRGVLMSSVAIVSVLTIGIGYQQQTSGLQVHGSLAMPMEDEIMPPIDLLKLDEPMIPPGDMEPDNEPVVWCCNADVSLCYEQAQSNGCGEDAKYADFETCAPACN